MLMRTSWSGSLPASLLTWPTTSTLNQRRPESSCTCSTRPWRALPPRLRRVSEPPSSLLLRLTSRRLSPPRPAWAEWEGRSAVAARGRARLPSPGNFKHSTLQLISWSKSRLSTSRWAGASGGPTSTCPFHLRTTITTQASRKRNKRSPKPPPPPQPISMSQTCPRLQLQLHTWKVSTTSSRTAQPLHGAWPAPAPARTHPLAAITLVPTYPPGCSCHWPSPLCITAASKT
mmetsp:Transcript_38725/g.123024  ORF Transcript_38725/g.123024 Transcript_38725/m.123024 type:complete len:231 (-) Transcript_38725:261-953(-)